MTRVRLFCLPYAGGSAMVYARWKRELQSFVDLELVELAGRGRRYSEPFYDSFERAVEDICARVRGGLDGRPYAVWGHSMGSLLAFEAVSRLRETGCEWPAHVFFSGRYPPHIRKNGERALYELPDAEFRKVIFRLGGTPKEVLEEKELQDIFIPILRADYKLLHGYRYRPKEHRLGCGISVLNGRQDAEIVREDILQWKIYTDKECRFYSFDGGHFYINDNEAALVDLVNRTLGGIA